MKFSAIISLFCVIALCHTQLMKPTNVSCVLSGNKWVPKVMKGRKLQGIVKHVACPVLTKARRLQSVLPTCSKMTIGAKKITKKPVKKVMKKSTKKPTKKIIKKSAKKMVKKGAKKITIKAKKTMKKPVKKMMKKGAKKVAIKPAKKMIKKVAIKKANKTVKKSISPKVKTLNIKLHKKNKVHKVKIHLHPNGKKLHIKIKHHPLKAGDKPHMHVHFKHPKNSHPKLIHTVKPAAKKITIKAKKAMKKPAAKKITIKAKKTIKKPAAKKITIKAKKAIKKPAAKKITIKAKKAIKKPIKKINLKAKRTIKANVNGKKVVNLRVHHNGKVKNVRLHLHRHNGKPMHVKVHFHKHQAGKASGIHVKIHHKKNNQHHAHVALRSKAVRLQQAMKLCPKSKIGGYYFVCKMNSNVMKACPKY